MEIYGTLAGCQTQIITQTHKEKNTHLILINIYIIYIYDKKHNNVNDKYKCEYTHNFNTEANTFSNDYTYQK